MFINPIISKGADPWVIRHNGFYYYCYTGGRSICVKRADSLHEIGKYEAITVWHAPDSGPYSREIWAPELHFLAGKWYIYFAADDGDNFNHRMYVLEGISGDPQGVYAFKGKIHDPSDKWAIDGTVYTDDAGKHYFIWSGWEGDVNVRQDIYIAPMSSPLAICGNRIMLSYPSEPWETIGTPAVNEGPQILIKDKTVHIIYSASGSWTDDYCLGRLTLTGDNPMEAAAWKKSGPVFSKAKKAYGPGHASFVKSPDGKQDWIAYHACLVSGAGWAGRSVRIQRFQWNQDGTPDFGTPLIGIPLEEPS
ncbi:MAG: glycoside hydrolase family 43 protein [Eubacteriales bacterium]|nr:glycoside hydrolase family 43 protein [Eubacteriales bacterium]